jgi:hypothetical protein
MATERRAGRASSFRSVPSDSVVVALVFYASRRRRRVRDAIDRSFV